MSIPDFARLPTLVGLFDFVEKATSNPFLYMILAFLWDLRGADAMVYQPQNLQTKWSTYWAPKPSVWNWALESESA